MTLGGKITPEISAKIQGKVGVQLDGKLLAYLLGLVAGPEGEALVLLLDEAGLLPSTPFTVELAGDAGFKLSVELKGEVALSWSKTHRKLSARGPSVPKRKKRSFGRKVKYRKVLNPREAR